MKRQVIKSVTFITLLLLLLVEGGQALATTGDTVLLNEILASHTGTDNSEYIELFGIPGTSLAGLSLIVVESDNISSLGAIDRRIDFGTTDALGANGFYLVGNPAGLAGNYGVTPNVNINNDFLENSSMTVALVETSSLSGSSVSGSEVVQDAVALTDGGAGDTFFFNAPVVGPDGSFFPAGARRVADGADTDTATDWVISDFNLGPANTPTAGTEDGGGGGDEFGTCGDPATLIHEVQGSGLTTPLTDTIGIVIEGVVVGDFQNNDQPDNGELNGFYVQEEDGQADGTADTSEGIFVFAPGGLEVSIGNRVRIGGDVVEFETSGGASSLTELTNVSNILVCEASVSLPALTEVTLPVASTDFLERYEGMLVTLQELVISEYFNFDRFNEIVLTADRQFQPTALAEPGSSEASQIAQANSLSRITLDDGRSEQNPDPLIHPNGGVFDLSNRFRGGDVVQAVTGVIDDTFGLYRIQPTEGAIYIPQNSRPESPDDVGGNLKVASFNVLNYFLTLDDGSDNCGPEQNQECRGADDATEFERQRAKILSALSLIEADVFGLIEMENTEGVEPLQDIVNGLNDELGAGTYDFIDTGTIGGDAIKVGLIYKPATITPVGDYAILDSSVDERFLDSLNRPVLAQSFQDNSTGGIFTVAVNHLKSKGSDCNDVGDPDTGDGAGNCNLTREAAAEALVDWLAMDPTNSDDFDFLIIGDLNSYDKEDPIDAILAGPDGELDTDDDYSDLLFQELGEFAYSYVFDGQLGYLDHALANQELLSEVSGVTVWHINADEPDILDYDTTFKQDAQDDLYEPNAFRSSDHDPVIVGLEVCDEIAPTLEVTVSPDNLWPPNHKYVTVQATVTTSDNFDPAPTVSLVGVSSNEPDSGLDAEDLPDDIVSLDDTTFDLRAERAEDGAGRIYTITYEVTDFCGNSTVTSAEVSVSHDQGQEK